MYYILFYTTVDSYIEKRVPYRPEHLALVNEMHKNGTLLMAGALANPADGAVLIFKADGPEIAEEFVKRDPYVKNGLIKEWKVREWTVVVGNE
ncbi:MAG: YciI-like protein [Bacteroidales bacterium]